MKKIILIVFLLFANLTFAGEQAKEIFGKLIIKVDTKKFEYFRPGSFTDHFLVRSDQALIAIKGRKKTYLVLTHIDEFGGGDFSSLCNESYEILKKMQAGQLIHRLEKISSKDCQILTENRTDVTFQRLHLYRFRGVDFVLSLSGTRSKKDLKVALQFVEDFLKENTYELR